MAWATVAISGLGHLNLKCQPSAQPHTPGSSPLPGRNSPGGSSFPFLLLPARAIRTGRTYWIWILNSISKLYLVVTCFALPYYPVWRFCLNLSERSQILAIPVLSRIDPCFSVMHNDSPNVINCYTTSALTAAFPSPGCQGFPDRRVSRSSVLPEYLDMMYHFPLYTSHRLIVFLIHLVSTRKF